MKKIKDLLKKHKYLWLSLLLTLILIGIIFAFKGIYPFGKELFNIGNFDYNYVPIYYKLWDLLHGFSSLLVDWNLGVQTIYSLLSNSLWSPTSLMIGLFNRNFIPYAMSYIIIIKLLVISLCTYIALYKMFPKSKGVYLTISTLAYTFSGWTFFMLFNISYLDVIALFPLLVLSYYRLMKDNKWGMYILLLTIIILSNYYVSWFVLLFIIGVTIISLCTLDIKEKIKKLILVLLFTLLSIGMSSIMLLPIIDEIIIMINTINMESIPYLGELFLKIVYLLPLVVPIVFTIKQFFIKKDKRINIFFALLLGYLLIGMFIPFINSIWLLNTNSGYPFRYSFIPSFILILSSLYYLNNNFKVVKQNNKLNVILPGCLLIVIGILAYLYRKEYLNQLFTYIIGTYSQFFCLLILFIISIVVIMIIVKTNKKIFNIYLLLISCMQILIYGYYFIGNNGNMFSSSLNTQIVGDKFDLVNDGYNYIDNTGSLNINLSSILNVPSMGTKMDNINEYKVNFSNRMGYYAFDNIIYARGGTLFSNLLMQNKYYFSYIPLDERLYTLIDKKDDYYLYSSKYNLNYIIPYNGKIVNEYSNILIDNVNLLYKELFDKEDNLMNTIEDKKITLSKDNVYYFYSYSGFTYDIYNSILEQDKDYYRNSFVSYDKYISEIIINGEDIELDLSEYEDLRIAYINIDDYIKFVESINDYEVTTKIDGNKKIYNYKAEKDTSVLIPINYDESLVVKVNDKKVDYKLNIYNMISIDIKKGDNKIEISYEYKNVKEGIIISVISLVLLFTMYLINKKK